GNHRPAAPDRRRSGNGTGGESASADRPRVAGGGHGHGTPRNAGFDNPADEVTSPARGSHANDDDRAAIAAGKRDQPDTATRLDATAGGHPGCDDRSRQDGPITGGSVGPTDIASGGDSRAEQPRQR